MARTILVTGATGTVGGHVVMKLAGREGITVRAGVRDPGSVAMAASNITPVKFLYEDAATMQAACEGVDAVFWVAPVTQNMAEMAAAFLVAATAAGVPHLVKLSVMGVDDAESMLVSQWHREMEAAMRATGVPWTSLRPGGFMQNFLSNSAPRPDGNMYAPLGDSKTAYIDVRDIAEVAVRCLTRAWPYGQDLRSDGTGSADDDASGHDSQRGDRAADPVREHSRGCGAAGHAGRENARVDGRDDTEYSGL